MKNSTKGLLYLIFTIFFFSTYEVVSKTLIDKVNPFQINFIRFFIGGVILLFFLIIKKDLLISFKDMLSVAAIGILNVVLSMNIVQLALYVPGSKASVSAVIFSSNPIFVCIFASFLDNEKLSVKKIIGLLIGIAGILTIFFEKMGFSDFKSPVLALISAVLYGLYTVLGRKISVRIGSLKMNAYSFLIGSLALLPVLLIFKMPVLRFDYSGIWQVLYLSVFVTGIAYLTYFKGLSIAGAGKGSLVFFMKPVLASAIAVIFLREHVTLNLIAGTLLILCGIGTVVKSKT